MCTIDIILIVMELLHNSPSPIVIIMCGWSDLNTSLESSHDGATGWLGVIPGHLVCKSDDTSTFSALSLSCDCSSGTGTRGLLFHLCCPEGVLTM